MAVDVSRIPNNNKFDPVREAILDLQTQLEEEGQIAYDGTLTLSEGTAVTLTGGSTFTANQSGDTTITIGVDLSVTTNAASGGGSLSYLDGEFTYTPPDLSSFIELTDLSISTSATPSGGGALSYDDTTGVFTFTPADAGTGLTLQQVTANGNSTTYGISTGNITVQPSGTGSGIVTIQANSVGDARLDLTAGTGGTGVIKTTNDVAITFEPNATEKVVIASDGNMNVYEKLAVGKTTAAATYHLEVDGTALANNFITSMTASGTTYTGTVSQYYNALQIRTGTGGTISLGGSGPMSVQNNVAIKDGDLDVNGDVTADFFIGDGSQLTNIAGTSSDLDDVTTNGATTTNDISTGRITIANNVSTGGFGSFDDYQILLYKNGTSVSESYGMGVESNNFMFNSDDHYRFYVDNSIKVTINSSGNVSATSFTGDGSGLTSVDADTLDGYQLSGTSSVSDKIFNNKGLVHSTFTDFNTVMNAGANYLQAGTNGPTGNENDQWYGFMLGLGSDYNTTTGNTNGYASQLYWNRQSQGGSTYLWARDLEAGTWGSWRKMSAGNADNAGTLNGVAGSSFLRSDADDTATGKITINNNSNSINDPTLTISSSQGGGSFGRLMFSGTSTVAGVINRSDAGSHLYFDEDATTGDYHFRSSGRAYYYGNLTVGSTNDTDGKLVVRGDNNSGMVSYFKNLDTGTTSYAEVIVRSVDGNNDLRLGSSKNYTDTQWQGGWVFAPRSLKLKSNNDVTIFAGGTDNSDIVASFTSTGLGVGTTLPSGILDIQGSSTSDHLVRFWNKDSSGTGKSIVRIANSGNNTLGSQLQMTDNTYYLATLTADRTNGLNFYVGQMSGYTDNLRMKIDINGNVGIGTTDTPMKLTVRGGFIALNSSNGSSASALYISPTNENTFNSGYGQDIDDKDMWLNYRGYNDGFTRFRDVRIGNGKGTAFAFFEGSTQRVGIGTESPDNKLHVRSSDNEGIFMEGTGGGHWFNFKSGTSNLWSMGAQSGLMGWYNRTDYTYKMVITDSGNVGIGTTSPNHKLTIDEATGTSYVLSARNTNDNLQIKLGTTTGGYANIQASTVSANAAYNMSIQADGGNVGIGTTTPAQKFHVEEATTYIGRFAYNANNYVDIRYDGFNVVGGGMVFHTVGTEKMRITTGGNIGINQTNPQSKLHITNDSGGSGGYLKITDAGYNGDVRFGMADGVNNDAHFGTWTNNNIYAYTNGSPRMRITDDGKVLIGTTTNFTSQVLQVNGFIDQTQTTAAFRLYNGSTFVGGLGNGQWAYSSYYLNDYAVYASNNLLLSAGGTYPSFIIKSDTKEIGFGDSTYNCGLYAISNNQTRAIDTNWGFQIQRTSGVDDYNVRMKFYPEAGTSRKLGFYNPRYNSWIMYADGNTDNNDCRIVVSNDLYVGGDSNLVGTLTNSSWQVTPREYGSSMVGNFGQWQAHSSYTNFNTVPAYWGWNYVQGNTNAPNTSSSQWYRGRFSLGDAYGLGTSSNDYWMEIAVPRYNYAGGDAGQMFVRACEDGVEGSWYQVGRKIIGDFTATGDVVAYGSSDKRLKDNITPIPNALDKVNSIGGYEFDWNNNQETYEGHDVGVIAQEVEEVMPEVVTTREDGYKAVKYEKMVPLLIEAIKEQQKQIDELKARLDGST